VVSRYYTPPARTAIGLRVKDGVVLAVEKLVHSKLLVPAANRRIQTIDRHVGLVRSRIHHRDPPLTASQASSGLLADGRHLANRARDEAGNYRDNYREPSPVKVCLVLSAIDHVSPLYMMQALADRLGLYVQAYTLYSSVRPFGCCTILGGVDKDGPSIYVIEPSGVFYVRIGYRADQSLC